MADWIGENQERIWGSLNLSKIIKWGFTEGLLTAVFGAVSEKGPLVFWLAGAQYKVSDMNTLVDS